MKTPIELPDALAEQARRVAQQEGTTLRALVEGEGYRDALERVAQPALLQRALVHDARVAALCLFHGVLVLWATDRDYSRFPDLTVVNPLAKGSSDGQHRPTRRRLSQSVTGSRGRAVRSSTARSTKLECTPVTPSIRVMRFRSRA